MSPSHTDWRGRSVEGHEDPVHDDVEAGKSDCPAPVANLGSAPRRVDDVNEHDRSRNALVLSALAHPRQELLDRLLIADPWPLVGTRQRYELLPGDVISDGPTLLEGDRLVVPPMQDEGGDRDHLQDAAHVDLLDHPGEVDCGAGARAEREGWSSLSRLPGVGAHGEVGPLGRVPAKVP